MIPLASLMYTSIGQISAKRSLDYALPTAIIVKFATRQTLLERYLMGSADRYLAELLHVYRKMLEFIRKPEIEHPDKDGVIRMAEVNLSRVENEIIASSKIQMERSSVFFGHLGWKYDFQLKVVSVHESEIIYELQCVDGKGRLYSVRVQKEEADVPIIAGISILFRGQVQDKRTTRGKCITFVEAVSGVQLT
ncbi:MAG: hypothetical protein VB050_09395 [Geobacteraceae bacterium]|nr:hypothetical protein [Geobacteraceae bacterium]